MDRTIYVANGTDYVAMTVRLLEKADIAHKIPKGAKVALKPNLVVASPASSGATTHREVLEGCIQYLQQAGVKDLSIIEGSWVGDRTERAFRVCKYDTLSQEYNVPLYDLQKDETVPVKTAVGKVDICKRALEIDYLINLPVLKGHCQTTMTCALKNCKGCLPNTEKRHFHSMGLMKPIAALAAVLKPSLTIVDNICGDMTFEEGGNPVQMDRIYLGEDMVQLDAFGCEIMGIDPYDVPYIELAEQYGAGKMAYSDSDIVEIDGASKPQATQASGVVADLVKNVCEKSACSACYGNLVHALHTLEQQGKAYTGPIAIGQGWLNAKFDGVGVGDCCACAEQFVPGCPPSANDIITALQMAD